MDLNGKVAIITGGARGYGRGIAAALRKRNVAVWITGRDQAALDKTASELDVRAIRADVTSTRDWDQVLETVLTENDKVDILVNNAGAGIRIGPLDEMTDLEIQESISVNLTGAVFGCQRVSRLMKQARTGTIINISSVCQKQAWPGFSVYSAAKAGLAQLSNCLYTELRDYGVRVTTLIPSWGATEFAENAGLPAFPEKVRDKSIQPEELGKLVVTICELPAHLEIQDMTLWPLVQKVEPL
jgi:NAD(P)-dependent dehydrogenase (short-subunit alcohol dehydrogenase family)